MFSVSLPWIDVGREQIATGLARERRVELERSAVAAELDVRARATKATFDSRVRPPCEPIERDVCRAPQKTSSWRERSFEVGELTLADSLVDSTGIDRDTARIPGSSPKRLGNNRRQMAAGVLR